MNEQLNHSGMLPIDLKMLSFNAKIDYITMHTPGKVKLPSLDGTAKWPRKNHGERLTIHDATPADIDALVSVFGPARLLEMEIAIDVRPGKFIPPPAKTTPRNPDLPVAEDLYQIKTTLEKGRVVVQKRMQGFEKSLSFCMNALEEVAQGRLELADIVTRSSSAELAEYVRAEYGPKYTVEGANDLLNGIEEVATSQSFLTKQLSADLSTLLETYDTKLSLCTMKIAMEAAND